MAVCSKVVEAAVGRSSGRNMDGGGVAMVYPLRHLIHFICIYYAYVSLLHAAADPR